MKTMHNEARVKAKHFLTAFDLREVTLASIQNALRRQGYTLIEFNTIYNGEHVRALIDSLGLEDAIARSRGFTYVDRYRRLVFLNEDLSDEEKLVVLAHEEGHIFCGHFTSAPIIGNDVAEEHEANEFSHYILNPGPAHKWRTTLRRHRKAALLCAVLLAALLAGISGCQRPRYYGDYYLTSTGSKYHQRGCIFVKDKTTTRRMTEDEFLSGSYEPCGICLPEGTAAPPQ